MITLGMSHNIPLDRFAKELAGYKIIEPKQPFAVFAKDEALKAISCCDAFITMVDFPCDKEMLDAGVKLKVVGNLGSGFDNVDVAEATKKGVLVLNTPQSVVAPTSEMTMTLILSICRNVVWYDRTFRADRTCHKNLLLERDMCLEGKTLGILGFGRIGKAVAQKALAFGMHILYYDVYRAPENVEKDLHATFVDDPETVLKQADVVTIHMAYTPESRHFINKQRLSLMKPTAYLVNASRGPIVSEEDLYECLLNHGIRGAALDVHESEPHVSEKIASLENVVITPHICTNIAEVRLNMFGELVTGLCGWLEKGIVPTNLVNKDVLIQRNNKC